MKAAGEVLWTVVVLLAIAAMLGLAGCSGAPRVPAVVQVPVPGACLRPGSVPPLPAIASDAELARMDDFDLVRTLARERVELLAWFAEILPVLEACARVPLAPSWSIRR